MVCSCCDFERAADRQFTAEKAAKELQAYRKGRVGPTTRLLRDGIVDAGLNRGSLLDVGGGVGALTFELLDRGMTGAVIAEASAAYVARAGEEAIRRGRSTSVEIVQGDFLLVSEKLPSANLVTLDRVVCCHPFYEPMLEAALRHAEQGFAFSYPKERWYVKALMRLENARRARKSGFRTFVHPPVRMRQIVERSGFELASRRGTVVWSIELYVRRG